MDVESVFNKYAGQAEDEQKTALTKSALISHRTNPDQHAENIKKAKKAGLPPALAKPATREATQEDLHGLIDEFHNLRGVTAQHMSNPDVAKLAQDDHKTLSLWEDLVSPTLKALPRVVAHTAGSFAQMPVSGLAALGKLIHTGSFHEANKVLEDNQNVLNDFYLKTPEEQKGSENIGLAMKPFEMAGSGLAGLFELVSTQDIMKATAVVEGKDPGSNIGVPLANVIGQASAMFGLGEIGKTKHGALLADAVNKHITNIVDTAKESKLKQRDADLFKSFTKDASKDSLPVSMPVDKFESMLAEKGLKPDEVLDDATHYYEAKYEGGKVELTASELAGIAEHVTPEHIKEMSVEGAPSVSELEKKAEAGNPATKQKQVVTQDSEVKPDMIRPAVQTDEGIKVGADGDRHTDIVKDAPELDRGFTLDNGKTIIGRKAGADWLKGNRPDLYDKLPEDQKTALHSEGLWDVLKNERGTSPEISSLLESIRNTDSFQTVRVHVQNIAKQIYKKGMELKEFTRKIKETVGDMWSKVEPHISSIWDSITKPLRNEAGLVGIDINTGVKAAQKIVGDIRDTKTGKMVEKLMTPGLDAAHGIVKGVQSLVLPSAKTPEHLTAAELLGAKLGKMHRNQEIAADSLRPDATMFDKMGVNNEKIDLTQNPGIRFMSDMSQGRKMEPKMERIAKKITALFDDRLSQLEAADVPVEQVRENYFPGVWTNESRKAFNLAIGGAIEQGKGKSRKRGELYGTQLPLKEWEVEDKQFVRDRVKLLMDGGKGSEKDGLQYLARTPFKGKESFRKGKVFDDIMTAVEFGLEPISPNPIDIAKLKLAEMDRSIMANAALQDWRASGDEKFLRVGQKVPEGWVKVNDKYGTVYGPRDMAGEDVYIGQPILGHRIVKEPVADILNNYLSSSLYNNKYFGTIYKGYMGAANALNQSQLGVGSFFHVGFTEAEVTISSGANLLKDVYGVAVGNRTIKQAAKSALAVPRSFIKTPMEGDAILKEWRNPGSSMNPRIQQVAKAAELAGGGFKMEQGLRTEQTSKLIKDWYSEHKIRAALRSPIATVELMAKPIMDYIVPRQKAGVFGHLAWRIIEQNPGKSLEQLTPQFRQAWNRVDARLGQVRYDRLFMNNSAKNAIQGLVRAPGWSGGTIAEIGGSLKDTVAFVKEWQETGKAPAELPDRVAYTISLMAGVTAINGVLTYAFTGEKPNGTDWWAFRTGGTDEYGRPERFVLPTYQKDVYAYLQDPGKTALAKTHPVISIMGDLIENKDYYNVTIANEDDSEILKEIERGIYVLKQFEPFWTRGARKEAQRGGGLMETLQTNPAKLLAPQFGIMPATSAYTLSPAEKLMNKYIGQQIPEGGRTQDAADTSKARRELVRALRNGATIESLPDKLQGKLSTLTDRQRKNIEKDAEMTPLQSSFHHLQDPTLAKSIKIWAKATDAERDQIRDQYETKINKYMIEHDPEGDELDKFNKQIDAAEERK